MCIWPTLVQLACFDPSPAFPVPEWKHGTDRLRPALESIDHQLKALISREECDNASFSVEITSQTSTLWSSYHTARKRDSLRPGAPVVDGQSIYRIASISKVFTVLGLLYQQAAGNLSLDDPVTRYIHELTAPDAGEIPWHDITLRSMASQLSGLPRDFGLADVLSTLYDPTLLGLPPRSNESLPQCIDPAQTCTREELLSWMKRQKPLFAPNMKSSYSNVAFSMLGLVLENATGMDYSRYIETSILGPLEMDFASLETPDDEHAVLPLGSSWWDIDEGVNRPTGGVYASSSDMSKFSRYILTHYNSITTGVNWFQPASYSSYGSNFGMPFEMYQTEELLPKTRWPVTFVTKAGSLPGYFSNIAMMPEYGLSLSILVAGHSQLVGRILARVTSTMLRAAEEAVWEDMAREYDGVYTTPADDKLDSRMALKANSSTGLTITEFISNSTDVLHGVLPLLEGIDTSKPWHAQLVPTLLFKDEEKQRGEIWRVLSVQHRDGNGTESWGDFCIGNWDTGSYAGVPINEVVFWEDRRMELPAWGVNLTAGEVPKMVFQDL